MSPLFNTNRYGSNLNEQLWTGPIDLGRQTDRSIGQADPDRQTDRDLHRTGRSRQTNRLISIGLTDLDIKTSESSEGRQKWRHKQTISIDRQMWTDRQIDLLRTDRYISIEQTDLNKQTY